MSEDTSTVKETGVGDQITSVWSTPFGGFHVGGPITDPRESIAAYLEAELEDTNTAQYVKDLIELECGTYTIGPGDPTTLSDDKQRIFFAYEDTSIGGCEVLNPLYQFCRDDDIVPPINEVDSTGVGMGRVYSETYRENMHVLWMTFGTPRYSNLTTFYRQAYNQTLIKVLASNDTTLSCKVGTILGSVAGLALSIPLIPFIAAVKAYDLVEGTVWGGNTHKYYELKPAMHNYYKVVNTILASLAVHMNLIPNGPAKIDGVVESDDERAQQLRQQQESLRNQFPEYSEEEIRLLTGMGEDSDNRGKVPVVLEAGPDIVRILSERHRRRRENRTHLYDTVDNHMNMALSGLELEEKLINAVAQTEAENEDLGKWRDSISPDTGAVEKIDVNAGEESIKDTLGKVFRTISDTSTEALNKIATGASAVWDKFTKANDDLDNLIGTVMGENAFIGFRIEKGSSQEETISNSIGETSLASNLKAMASGARSRTFDFAGGNLGLGPIDTVVSAVSTMVGTVASAVGLGALSDMITRGSGYLDIPKVWEDSSFSKSYSFDIKLQSSYADELSIYQSIYIPLALLMAAAFPLGIGKNSYTSPFLLQAYSKGMFSIPLGIISSLSIRRGDSENGWTHEHLPTVVDVSITIEDLSPMMYLSMTDKHLLEAFRANTTMQDYYATLAGVGLQERSSSRNHMLKKWRISRLLWAKNTFNMGMFVHKIGSGAPLRNAYRLFGKPKKQRYGL